MSPVLPPGSPPAIAEHIVDALSRAGIDLIATLPDAWLTDLIETLDRAPGMDLVRVSREDEGIGICAGAYLGGRGAALLCQNAGFLLSVNAVAGIALHHQIPILILLVQRGEADDDQFFQVYKGRVTVPVIEALGLPYHRLHTAQDVDLIPAAARQARLARSPVILLLTGNLLRGGR